MLPLRIDAVLILPDAGTATSPPIACGRGAAEEEKKAKDAVAGGAGVVGVFTGRPMKRAPVRPPRAEERLEEEDLRPKAAPYACLKKKVHPPPEGTGNGAAMRFG